MDVILHPSDIWDLLGFTERALFGVFSMLLPSLRTVDTDVITLRRKALLEFKSQLSGKMDQSLPFIDHPETAVTCGSEMVRGGSYILRLS